MKMKTKMKTRTLKPFEINNPYYGTELPINPFRQDHVHVGSPIGNNVVIFEGNKDEKGNVGYIIIVDCMTGNRTLVDLGRVNLYKDSFWRWVFDLFHFDNEISFMDKIRYKISSTCNYRPWLKWAFR